MINVTKTYLPDFDEYTKVLRRAWDKAWITNNGPLLQELEHKLKDYLGVKYLLFTSNGTVVLQMALKAYNISKEVITTPFSYVATTNAILWENCTPVFVDIDARNFCIDASKIEAAITENTQAIIATHVYGYACDIEKIAQLAAKYNLKVIYDGAHVFGCRYNGQSLLSYGDISTCSFHATKLFHTVEGGCIITNDDDVARNLMLFRQFGHVNDDYFSIGINAKNSEFHAAMGLCVLPKVDQLIEVRKRLSAYYDKKLSSLDLQRPVENEGLKYNYSYYPVLFRSETELLKVKETLAASQVNTRRYFHPSLNELPYLQYQKMPVSENISRRVLCLPLFYELTEAEIDMISSLILKACL